MIKEYMALKYLGYEVRVMYAFWTNWAFEKDQQLFKSGHIDQKDFIQVGGNPVTKRRLYFFSRLLFKLINFLNSRLHIPMPDKWLAGRAAIFLEKAALNCKAQLYIAHNLGALPASVRAAKKWKAKCGFDAEDYHRGEYASSAERGYGIAQRIEDTYLPLCNYITASSPLIAAAYREVDPTHEFRVIRNVFSRRFLQSSEIFRSDPSELRIFWFSQTVGPNRGIELLVDAIDKLPDCNISLHLMGDVPASFREQLLSGLAVPGKVHFIPPVPPDDIFSISARYDIGFSAEVPLCDNRDYCLTNKLFTYILAGNCILASNTAAQKLFFSQYPGLGLIYRYDDVNSLMAQLKKLYDDRALLSACRRNALQFGGLELNWESESKLFTDIVRCNLLNSDEDITDSRS